MKPRWMEKAAIAHYKKAGGFAKIFINDDGLQVHTQAIEGHGKEKYTHI